MGKLLVFLAIVALITFWWRRHKALAQRSLPYDKGPTIDVEPLKDDDKDSRD